MSPASDALSARLARSLAIDPKKTFFEKHLLLTSANSKLFYADDDLFAVAISRFSFASPRLLIISQAP